MKYYHPMTHGAVEAIRIFRDKNGVSMAELVFCFGEKETIDWTNDAEREKFAAGISGHTLYYDERCKPAFKDVLKPF